jgi:dUTP pyrophosphatase
MSVTVFFAPCPDFDPTIGLPAYQTSGAAGADVSLCLPVSQRDQGLTLMPMERAALPTALKVELPMGYEIQVRPRSGLSFKQGVTVLNAPGTIDADYRGEIKVILINLSKESVTFRHGDRIAQLVVAPVLMPSFQWKEELATSQRGEKGFGSTGLAIN